MTSYLSQLWDSSAYLLLCEPIHSPLQHAIFYHWGIQPWHLVQTAKLADRKWLVHTSAQNYIGRKRQEGKQDKNKQTCFINSTAQNKIFENFVLFEVQLITTLIKLLLIIFGSVPCFKIFFRNVLNVLVLLWWSCPTRYWKYFCTNSSEKHFRW